MGVIVYKHKEEPLPSVERIVQCLLLPTVDDTQTALANEDIYISEFTAIKLRETAQFEECDLIAEQQEENCYNGLKRIFKRVWCKLSFNSCEKQK